MAIIDKGNEINTIPIKIEITIILVFIEINIGKKVFDQLFLVRSLNLMIWIVPRKTKMEMNVDFYILTGNQNYLN